MRLVRLWRASSGKVNRTLRPSGSIASGIGPDQVEVEARATLPPTQIGTLGSGDPLPRARATTLLCEVLAPGMGNCARSL